MSVHSEHSSRPGMSQWRSKIIELEQAIQQVNSAKRQLSRNTAEAKCQIQCSISRHLEVLRNREVWLLNQLDVVSGAKEEVLHQQQARLNKTLGLLQSSLPYKESEIPELPDLRPEETPNIAFKADPVALRDSILNFGQINANGLPTLQSPFVEPGHPALSLPRHFEDYDDAEHHVLYKTVEEVKQAKAMEPCVHVDIPKLSSHLEGWLARPTTLTTSTTSAPKFSFPQISSNTSDWLLPCRERSAGETTEYDVQKDAVSGYSSDASVQTWLMKMKQTALEDEEDDFEYIEEFSGTQGSTCSQSSMGRHRARSLSPVPAWPTQDPVVDLSMYKNNDLWLQSSGEKAQESTDLKKDLGQYFTNLRNEMDRWLSKKAHAVDTLKPISRLCHHSCTLPSCSSCPSLTAYEAKSRVTNPWLLNAGEPKFSHIQREMSTFTNVFLKHCDKEKWLLHHGEGLSQTPVKSSTSSPLFDHYRQQMSNTTEWLKTIHPPEETVQSSSVKPKFSFTHDKNDNGQWLKVRSCNERVTTSFAGSSAMEGLFTYHKIIPESGWLLEGGVVEEGEPILPFEMDIPDQEGVEKWLLPRKEVKPGEKVLKEENPTDMGSWLLDVEEFQC